VLRELTDASGPNAIEMTENMQLLFAHDAATRDIAMVPAMACEVDALELLYEAVCGVLFAVCGMRCPVSGLRGVIGGVHLPRIYRYMLGCQLNIYHWRRKKARLGGRASSRFGSA
jgi:hypothetical protein